MDVHGVSVGEGIDQVPVLSGADDGVLTESMVEVNTSIDGISRTDTHHRPEALHCNLIIRHLAEVLIGDPWGQINIVNICPSVLIEVLVEGSKFNGLDVIDTHFSLLVQDGARGGDQSRSADGIDVSISADGEAFLLS